MELPPLLKGISAMEPSTAVPLVTIGVICILVLATGFAMYKLYKRHKNQKAEKRAEAEARARSAEAQTAIMRWVGCIEYATSIEALYLVGHRPAYYAYTPTADEQKRIDAATAEYSAACARIRAQGFAEKVDAVSGEPLAVALLMIEGFYSGHDTVIAFGKTKAQMGEYFTQLLADGYDSFRAGNRTAMADYIAILEHNQLAKFCEYYGIAQPTYPATWDETVGAVIASPTVSDFRGTPRLDENSVLLLASEALYKRCVWKAKLARAYSTLTEVVESGYGNARSKQTRTPYGDALGSIYKYLLNELATHPDRFEDALRNTGLVFTKQRPAGR